MQETPDGWMDGWIVWMDGWMAGVAGERPKTTWKWTVDAERRQTCCEIRTL